MNRAGPASALQGCKWISRARPSGLPRGTEAPGLALDAACSFVPS